MLLRARAPVSRQDDLQQQRRTNRGHKVCLRQMGEVLRFDSGQVCRLTEGEACTAQGGTASQQYLPMVCHVRSDVSVKDRTLRPLPENIVSEEATRELPAILTRQYNF